MATDADNPCLDLIDLGRMAYPEALALQREANLAVSEGVRPDAVLLVEHDPVVTLSHRQGVADHLLASPIQLRRLGIAVCQTDRGGDITYHGPGQLVAYPILKLGRHGLNLGRYMRLLDAVVTEAVAGFGVAGQRVEGATGVWVRREGTGLGDRASDSPRHGRVQVDGGVVAPATRYPDAVFTLAKLCAFGVRIRKNTTMHGLALNVTTDLSHFLAIDPCGLGMRPVTSLRELLGARCPSMAEVKSALVSKLDQGLRGVGTEASPAATTLNPAG